MAKKSLSPIKTLFFTALFMAAGYFLLWNFQPPGAEVSSFWKNFALTAHFPTALEDLAGQPIATWLADYFLSIFFLSFLITKVILFANALFLIEPNPAPVYDPTPMVELMKVSLPPISHLSDALYTCPGLDVERIELELAAEGSSGEKSEVQTSKSETNSQLE